MRSAVKYAIDAKGTHYMFKRFSRNRYGYSRWDGTQRIEGFDADDILDALSDDYLEDGNLQQALRRLMQEGVRGQDGRRTMGLREMMQRMRNMRQEQLNRYNMASGVMDDLREKLEEIKQLERQGIQHRLDDTSTDSQQRASSRVNSARVSKWSDSLLAVPVEISKVNLVRARTVTILHQNKSARCWR